MTKLFTLLPSLLYATQGTTSATGGEATTASLLSLLPFVLIIVVFWFILIRPQRKKDKADAAMRSALAVGDVITTRGGIIGKISKIKEDELTIVSGKDGMTLVIQRWAVASKEELISD